MGRGTIVGHQGEGLYSVALDYGQSVIDAKVGTLEALVAEYQAAIAEQAALLAPLEAEEATLLAAQANAITAYRNATDETWAAAREALDDATVAVIRKQVDLAEYRLRIDYLTLAESEAVSKLAYYQGLDVTELLETWCVDYTTTGAGLAATIEVNGEQPTILIAPGAPAPTAADGVFTARAALSPSAAYLNAAILPGWQKFSPTFRAGTITAINYAADTCDLDLDPATSSAQGLDINQDTSLSAVPIEYMTCNAGAFSVDDHVVVMFEAQDWNSPKVIGFVSNPKPCGIGIAREVHYRPLLGGHNEDWIFALDGALADQFLTALRTGAEVWDPPDDLTVEIKKAGDIWRTMNLGAVTTADEGGQGPSTEPIQWRYDTSGVLPGGEDQFYLVFHDSTGEIYDWSSTDGTLRVYTCSYQHAVPMVVSWRTPYELDWTAASYEVRAKETSTGTIYFHYALGRIGFAGPDVARMNGVGQLDPTPDVPPGSNVRDMTLQVDTSLTLST